MASAGRPIRVGTDCSGMEAPIMALRNLKAPLRHIFSCDVCPKARATIEANFPHDIFYDDLCKRDNQSAPAVDIYVAGFPCQSFSAAGKREGFKDTIRGRIVFKVLDYIRTKQPKVFLLENVSGIKSNNGGKTLKRIMKELEDLKHWNIYFEQLNTWDHGVPHDRKRCYWVGIKKTCDTGSFEFPEKIPCPPIENFLDRRPTKAQKAKFPRPNGWVARTNIVQQTRKLIRKGSDPDNTTFIMDIDSTVPRSKSKEGCTPCLTCCRAASGHWISSYNRRFNKNEMMRLQGMNPAKFKLAISLNQLGHQLGNTMSVNVLERMFCRILPAAGLTAALPDRWKNGAALKELMASRDLDFGALLKKGGFARRAQARKAKSRKAARSVARKAAGSRKAATAMKRKAAGAASAKRRRTQ